MKKITIDIKTGILDLVKLKLDLTAEDVDVADEILPIDYETQDVVYQYLVKEKDAEWLAYWLDFNAEKIIKEYGSFQNFYDVSYSQMAAFKLRELARELENGLYTFRLSDK